MTITYYLFIDKEFCIRNIFETLSYTTQKIN